MALEKWQKAVIIALMVLGISVFIFVFLVLMFPSRFSFQPTFTSNIATLAFLLTALGTGLLALATLFMARNTREMVQETAYERGQMRMTEFIAVVIDPLIELVKEVVYDIDIRYFTWHEFPLEQGVERVLKAENLDKFKVENQIANEEVAVKRYYIPYAPIEIFGERLNLDSRGFEFRRKHELEEKYKDLNKEILAYDKQVGSFSQMLGDIAVFIHSLLAELESFCSLEKNLQLRVIEISFFQMVLPSDGFEKFLSRFSTNEESSSARDYYMTNRTLIQDALFPKLNKSREHLDSMCSNLKKRLESIASMLEDIRAHLGEQYLISESAIKQIRKASGSQHIGIY